MSVLWDYAPQRPLLPRLCDELHSRGLTFGLWEAEPQPGTGAQLLNDAWALGAKADHYIAQAETPRDWPQILSDFRAVYPKLPAAIVTTFGGVGATASGYDPAATVPFLEHGFKCLVESYQNADPNATPAKQVWTATEKLGWPYAQPVAGVWDGYRATGYNLAAYPDYWVWLAETLMADDWATFRSLNLS